MDQQQSSLWRHADFIKLWVGETISLFGSQVTTLALPLTAALILQATPEQMGVLNAAEFVPFLLVGLLAGVWVDRYRRKPILIMGDIGRAILLFTIPAAAFFHALHMEQLYVVGFLVGILTVFFDVAYQSYLPSLVGREKLVEGNSKLEVSRAMSEIAGPGVAGVLVQIFTAPMAIVLDAVSFLVSALFVWRIRSPEPPLKVNEEHHMRQEIMEGLRIVVGNPSLLAIGACTATSNLFGSVGQAVFILYATRELNLDAAALGIIYGIASIGGLLGAVNSGLAAKRFGLGRAIIGSMVVIGIASLFIPLASGSFLAIAAIIIGARFIGAIGNTVYNINQVSYRQTITPHHLLGRMNASMRFIVWGTIPVGSLIGGVLGGAIGLRPTLLVGALGMLLAPLWVYFSPVRQLKEAPLIGEETKPENA